MERALCLSESFVVANASFSLQSNALPRIVLEHITLNEQWSLNCIADICRCSMP